MPSPCYYLIMFAFLLYEYWNNKFSFVQISYIMLIVQKRLRGVQINRVCELLEGT